MGDLISRSELIKTLRVRGNPWNNYIETTIREMPTAYDIDKVLQDLKEATIPIIDLKMDLKINGIQKTDDAVLYERAIETVKSGGKEL